MPFGQRTKRGKLTEYRGNASLTTMKTIEVQTLTGSAAELVELARREAGVVLTKAGWPVAQVLPMPERVGQRIAPLHPDAMEAGDDFDAPLPDEFWLGKA